MWRENKLETWGYLKTKLAQAGIKSEEEVHLSSDGAWLLDKNENRIAKNIVCGLSPYRNSHIGGCQLLWQGWSSRLEHVQDLVQKLRKRRSEHVENKLLPFMKELLGRQKEVWVWVSKNLKNNGEEQLQLRNIHITKQENFGNLHLLRKDHPLRKEKFFLSWSSSSPSSREELPPCQMPAPSQKGAELAKMLDYSDNLVRRAGLVEGVLHFLIKTSLDGIVEEYDEGGMISFKIGTVEYIYRRKNMEWELLGDKIAPLDVKKTMALSVENDKYNRWQTQNWKWFLPRAFCDDKPKAKKTQTRKPKVAPAG